MSLFSWLFPRRELVKSNKEALQEAWRNECITIMLSSGFKRNPHRNEDKSLFYETTVIKRVIIRKKE